MKFLKFIFLVSYLILPMLAVTSCNTIEGIGEDINYLGRSIDRAAEENR